MSRQLRRVAVMAMVLFAALFLNLNYLQVLQADNLSDNPRNSRGLIREYSIRRGSILAADGSTELARSERTDDELTFRRRYPQGSLYAHVTGFSSFVYGRNQVESAFNTALFGNAPAALGRNLADLLSGKERRGDDVMTTIVPRVQRAAADALGGRTGAVAALNPKTGQVLALWSSPSYDPGQLASHDRDEVVAAWERTEADPAKPKLNRATEEVYPPGSTFKLVTASAGLESGLTPETTFDDPAALDLPKTSVTLENFGGGTCNGGAPITLAQGLVQSCNTTFAQLGLRVGAETLVEQAEAFGLNQEWGFQLPMATSRIPTELNAPATAQSAIGQRDVRVTPLQMAMVAGTIANDGVLMKPRVVDSIRDFSGGPLRRYRPRPLTLPGASSGRAISQATADTLTRLMTRVVDEGTGTNGAISGVSVAGKTGTAQRGRGRDPTVWFTAFAPSDDPQVAVAVMVESGGNTGASATGGAVAAPVARRVIQAALTQGSEGSDGSEADTESDGSTGTDPEG